MEWVDLAKASEARPTAGLDEGDLADRMKTLRAIHKSAPGCTLALSNAGIASTRSSPPPPESTATYLSSLARAAKDAAFGGSFSSVVAGASSESDEMVDVPLYLGPFDGSGFEALARHLGLEGGSNEIITHQTDAAKDPHFIAFLPASVSGSSSGPTLRSLASEIDPSSRVEGEIVADRGHVPCFFAGKRNGEWVGLVSCAVFT